MFHHRGIAPHFFQLVKFPGFGLHDVYHDIYVVDQDPLQRLPAFMLKGALAAVLFNLVFHRIGDGLELGGVAGFTDDEKISYGLRDFAEVKAHNLLTFFFLYGFDDDLKKFAVPVEPRSAFFTAG